MVVEKNKAKASIYGHAGYALHKTLSTKGVTENQTAVCWPSIVSWQEEEGNPSFFFFFLSTRQESFCYSHNVTICMSSVEGPVKDEHILEILKKQNS